MYVPSLSLRLVIPADRPRQFQAAQAQAPKCVGLRYGSCKDTGGFNAKIYPVGYNRGVGYKGGPADDPFLCRGEESITDAILKYCNACEVFDGHSTGAEPETFKKVWGEKSNGILSSLHENLERVPKFELGGASAYKSSSIETDPTRICQCSRGQSRAKSASSIVRLMLNLLKRWLSISMPILGVTVYCGEKG
jgi:hypothetical protein